MTITIVEPELCFSAESVAIAYFPRFSAGIDVNGKILKLIRNNTENKFEIDWALTHDGKKIAVIDTEYKPNWSNGRYPFYSVARYTYKYNKGETDYMCETVKVRYYRQFPDQSFWMVIKSDMKEAGIVTGRIVVESPIAQRQQPRGFARDIEIFEFSNYEICFADAFSHNIEDYILQKLDEVDAL